VGIEIAAVVPTSGVTEAARLAIDDLLTGLEDFLMWWGPVVREWRLWPPTISFGCG
jgi:hypothetical protein